MLVRSCQTLPPFAASEAWLSSSDALESDSRTGGRAAMDAQQRAGGESGWKTVGRPWHSPRSELRAGTPEERTEGWYIF